MTAAARRGGINLKATERREMPQTFRGAFFRTIRLDIYEIED